MDDPFTQIFSQPSSDDESVVIGSPRVGQYQLLRVVGRGGMGMVYAAQQENPRREVAVKIMRDAVLTLEQRARFDREAQLLADLAHPNIASIFESGTFHVRGTTTPYYVMELIQGGQAITAYANHHDLTTRERITLMLQVCDAMQYAHERRVLHRDLKPGNILVGIDGRPRVIDFGIARVLSEASLVTAASTSQLAGTIQYMSPEQLDPQEPSPSTAWDVYALGVVLFELICDALPYDLDGRHPVAAMQLILQPQRRSPRSLAPSIDRDLEHILQQAVHRDPHRRYPSAGALAGDLGRYLRGDSIEARRDSLSYKAWSPVRRLARNAPRVAALIILIAAFVLLDVADSALQTSSLGFWTERQTIRWAAPHRTAPLH